MSAVLSAVASAKEEGLAKADEPAGSNGLEQTLNVPVPILVVPQLLPYLSVKS